MLIVQNGSQPGAVRNALVDLDLGEAAELRIAAAYVNSGGSAILLNAFRDAIGAAALDALPKTLITSFDYGITEPAALRKWSALNNASVFVAGADRVAAGSLRPKIAFHPKIYAFRRAGGSFGAIIGSANLTGRGFGSNTEAVWAHNEIDPASFDFAFEQARWGTVPLTAQLIDQYEALRVAQPPAPDHAAEVQPVPPPIPVPPGELQVFRVAIASGAIDPADYGAMWIQGEALQGGSGNQLELPRGAHRFFGLAFDQYEYPHNLTIGYPVLRRGAKIWEDRPLTWHGNNRMERLNLPTLAQGGADYSDSATMFRRRDDGSFELIVTPWDSDLSRAWRSASRANNTLFRLGTIATNRQVGLI
jgi:HKD family nuclease